MNSTIYTGDAADRLKELPGSSVNTCVTSPPYFGLRDYGVSGQIGLEETPEQYISNLVDVFREVKRVLRDDGTCWINIGDSYAGSGKNRNADGTINVSASSTKQGTNTGTVIGTINGGAVPSGCKAKDLIGIPWMLAFALRADGWYLRQDIIWAKPNPMPESVKDRCTKSHEYIFLLSKQPHYYYDADAIREPCVQNENANGFRGGAYCNSETFNNVEGGKRKNVGNYKTPTGWDTDKGAHGTIHKNGRTRYGGKKYTEDPDVFSRTKSGNIYESTGTRNKRSVWTVATKGFKEAHFATFPQDLIEPCIIAGCPFDGTVLDPFTGSGTTAVTALQNGRNFIGVEINPKYIAMAEKRIKRDGCYQEHMEVVNV